MAHSDDVVEQATSAGVVAAEQRVAMLEAHKGRWHWGLALTCAIIVMGVVWLGVLVVHAQTLAKQNSQDIQTVNHRTPPKEFTFDGGGITRRILFKCELDAAGTNRFPHYSCQQAH